MKAAVIVDGYSGGLYLAPEFRSRGIACVHVQSDAGIWERLRPLFDFTPYEKNIEFVGDLEAVVEGLSGFEVLCVLPGTETGVELADRLADRLGVCSNGTQHSEARRDKFLMVDLCRKAGLLVADQIKASAAAPILEWYARGRYPKVVVKPHKSAGTEDVFLCENAIDIGRAVNTILSKQNILGLNNTDVVVQEYLSGTEYFLDSVSKDGRHHFTDIWRYRKRSINGRDFVYDKNELCDPKDANIVRLIQYTEKVLNALGVKYGPAHTEVIDTERGPALVEIGARLDGLTLPKVNEAAIGYSPVHVSVDCYVDADAFEKCSANPYPIRKHARTVYLTSYQDGILSAFPGREKLEGLESFFQLTMRWKEGAPAKKTINYFTAPGFVTLIHEDPAVVEKDYQTIRQWEDRKALFEFRV